MPAPMPTDEFRNLAAREALAIVVAWSLTATAVIAVLLLALHVIALHGRRIFPPVGARIAGAITLGAFLGLASFFMWQEAFWWLLVAPFLIWLARWYLRERRTGELGLVLAATGAPWVLAMGWLLIVEPVDRTRVGGLDPRFLFAVAGLLVAGTGVAIALASDRAQAALGPQPRSVTDRVGLVTRAVDRGQAVGPVAAPAALAFAAGIAASTVATLALPRSEQLQPLGIVLPFAAFASVMALVWILTVPERVRHAHETMAWLAGRERGRWQRVQGVRLPLPLRSLPRLLASLPETDTARPLRIELLAVLGRDTEAVAELRRLPRESPEERLEHALVTEQLAAFTGQPDQRDGIRAALGDIVDEEELLEGRVALAYADARRAALQGGDAAEPLATVRSAIGDRANRYHFGYRRGVILVAASIAAVAVVVLTVLSLVF